MAFAIFFTGDLLRECAFSSRTSAFDQARRLVRLARLLAISHSCEGHTAAATASIAEPAWDEKTERLSPSIENFTRLETFGTPNHHWVEVSVNPNDPNVFSIRQRIVAANVVKRQ
jgi:hypothetical protein